MPNDDQMPFQTGIGNMLQIQRRVYLSDQGSQNMYIHIGTHRLLSNPGEQVLLVPNCCWESRAQGAAQASWNTLTRWPRFSCMQLVSLGASLINKVVIKKQHMASEFPAHLQSVKLNYSHLLQGCDW